MEREEKVKRTCWSGRTDLRDDGDGEGKRMHGMKATRHDNGK